MGRADFFGRGVLCLAGLKNEWKVCKSLREILDTIKQSWSGMCLVGTKRQSHVERRSRIQIERRVDAIKFVRTARFSLKRSLIRTILRLALFFEKQIVDFAWATGVQKRKIQREILKTREDRFGRFYLQEKDQDRREAVRASQATEEDLQPLESAHEGYSVEFKSREEGLRRKMERSRVLRMGVPLWIRSRNGVELVAISGFVLLSLSIVSLASLSSWGLVSSLFDHSIPASEFTSPPNDTSEPVIEPPAVPAPVPIKTHLAYPVDGLVRYWAKGSDANLYVGFDRVPQKASNISASRNGCAGQWTIAVGVTSYAGTPEYNRDLARRRANVMIRSVRKNCGTIWTSTNVMLVAVSNARQEYDDGVQRRAVILSVEDVGVNDQASDILSRTLQSLTALRETPELFPAFDEYRQVEFCVPSFSTMQCEDADWHPLARD